MTTVTPTIVIGLGEVGRRSVAYLKRRIYNAFGPLDSVFLLAVTLAEEGAAVAKSPPALPYELLPKEVLKLDLTGAHQGGARLRQNQSWLPEGVLLPDRVDRDTRAAARLAFMVDAPTLIPWLHESVRAILSVNARDAMMDKGFTFSKSEGARVYVVAALDDPVGSGLFLDFAHLAQLTLTRIGISQFQVAGIFYLPDSRSMTEKSGANVYAALKELDAHMNRAKKFEQSYTRTDRVDSNIPPFNHGCYLLDTINEAGIALGERDEASAMLGEWLFQATLTPCKQALDTPIAGASSREQLVEGRLAGYSGLGFAGFILPIDGFIDFCANRLAGRLLEDDVVGAVSSQAAHEDVGDFMTDQRLTPSSFRTNTLKLPGVAPGLSAAAGLENTPWSRLEERARQAARQLDGEELPEYARQIAVRAKDRREEMPRVLELQRNQLLSQANPNAIPLTLHFFNGLGRQLQRDQAAQEKEKEEAGKRRAAAANDLNRKGAALFRALASLPRSPIDYALVGLGAVVGFLVPLFLVSRLILNAVGGAPGYLMVAALWLLSWLAVGYIVWQLRGRIIQARINFTDSFRRYAAARTQQAEARETAAFYPDVVVATRERMEELQALHNRLMALKVEFQRASSSDSHLLDKIDFPLQRSLLTSKFINDEYDRHTSNMKQLFNSFREEVGTPDRWLKAPETLQQRILDFGRGVFKPLRAHTVASLAETAPPDVDPRQWVLRHAEELHDKSSPMWNYNKFGVVQELIGPLAKFALLAMEDPDKSRLDEAYRSLSVGLESVATGDAYRMQSMRLSQGFPLYVLRAFDDFRRHYETLLGGTTWPLHIRDDYLVAEDLKPYSSGKDPHSAVAMLFAVGRVGGIITQYNDVFVVGANGDGGKNRPLAATPKRAAAVLGLNQDLTAEVSRRVDAWVRAVNIAGAVKQIQAALEPPPPPPAAPLAEGEPPPPPPPPPLVLEEWEQEALRAFIEQLRS